MAILRIKDKDGNWREIDSILGEPGKPGKDGKIPVKGIDYFTDEEIKYIINSVRAYDIIYGEFETAPTNGFELGDRYYNIKDKVIYTAIDNEHWSDFSEDPKQNLLYLFKIDRSVNAFDGRNMVKFDKFIGSLGALKTESRDSIVAAINEIITKLIYNSECSDDELEEAIKGSGE